MATSQNLFPHRGAPMKAQNGGMVVSRWQLHHDDDTGSFHANSYHSEETLPSMAGTV